MGYSQTRAHRIADDADREALISLIRQHGPIQSTELGLYAAEIGINVLRASQLLRTSRAAGTVIRIGKWRGGRQALYMLPGQEMPAKGRPKADPEERAKVMADHDAWYASLATAPRRAQQVNVMRGRV